MYSYRYITQILDRGKVAFVNTYSNPQLIETVDERVTLSKE